MRPQMLVNPFTAEELGSVFEVRGGNLFWKVARGKKSRIGSVAVHLTKFGYVSVKFKGQLLMAHRVVWLLTHGEWPAYMLDHIDGKRDNNDPANLRPADDAQNQQNRKPRGAFKGISRLPHGRFQVYCDKVYLGSFDTPEEAARVYDTAAKQRFGSFAWLNFAGAA